MPNETVRARRGMVVAPHMLAAETGRDVIAEGGNAVEAMIASAAAIAVLYPHMNHIGGDGFWLVRAPSGKVHYIEACGPSGARATRAHYKEHGLERIPERGPLAALTVPGAVGGWIMALEVAKALGGKFPLSRLLEPAAALARKGYPASKSLLWRFTTPRGAAIQAPGFAETFLPGGKPPQPGMMLSAGKLPDTFDQLIRAGLDDFYRGDIGRELAGDLERLGSPVTRADLQGFRAVRREPLMLRTKHGTLYNSQPPTPGLVALMMLAMVEKLGPGEPESYEFVHHIVEATKRAFLIRDRVLTEFDRMQVDPASLLAPAAIEKEVRAIDRKKAAPWPQPAGKGDTVWMGSADASGTTVSYIQSVFYEFGSGVVLPSTGVLMQNRGVSFSLDPDALNALEPGRRPFHTLTVGMAAMNDGRFLSYGTMGGEGQTQTQAAVFTRFADHQMPIGEAIDRPRWILGKNWGTDVTNLRLEPRFPAATIEALKRAGHEVQLLDQPYVEAMGHAGGVVTLPNGSIEGAHDPRSDGGAAGC